jgi:hyperosmotically inducible protein
MNTATNETTAILGFHICATALAATVFVAACATNPSAGTRLDDAAITAKVKSRLAVDPQADAVEIDVDTTDGVVRLSGYVETEAEIDAAEQVAARTEGVNKVVNELKLGDPTVRENVDDALIFAKVKAKIAADPDLNPFKIDIDVQQGVVILSGVVREMSQSSEAEKLAAATSGVRRVRNLLTLAKS